MLARRSFLAGLGAAGAATPDTQPAGNSYIHSRKVLLWESTRKEFRELIEGGSLKAVIVPTGSTEQHNEHLAVINDTGQRDLDRAAGGAVALSRGRCGDSRAPTTSILGSSPYRLQTSIAVHSKAGCEG